MSELRLRFFIAAAPANAGPLGFDLFGQPLLLRFSVQPTVRLPGLVADRELLSRMRFEARNVRAIGLRERNGLDLPPEPEAWQLLDAPACLTQPILQLDLAKAGIKTILWATGFKFDFSWLEVGAFDENGMPFHKRGISAETGIYFLGLPELTNRASSFIYGCWHDAKYIADHIAIQRNYVAYEKR
ncbi:MAG: putative flavoprotein involved in transport [Paraburkholderia sp.]|nr:putative flavoprotein involved in transport [Paraburkholderia sp.]